jgi:hypothetical protein
VHANVIRQFENVFLLTSVLTTEEDPTDEFARDAPRSGVE